VGRLAAAAFSVALLFTGPASAGPERPLLGLVEGQEAATLVRVDPNTLRPLRANAIQLGFVSSWSFSPDRSRLVLATGGRQVRGCPQYSLRFFDARTMRPLTKLPIGGGEITALAWLRFDRLLALRYGCDASEFSLAVVDPVAGRILKIVPIEGDVFRLARTASELVALVALRDAIAPSRLLVFDMDGVVRARTLEAIPAGTQRGPEDIENYALPGLAVDGQRAFVVPAAGLVAEVDLATLACTYRTLVGRALTARLKASEGWSRRALWLGDGLLAVSGKDEEVFSRPQGGVNMRDRSAGVFVIDTRSWNVRMLDPDGDFFVRADRLLYVTRIGWDSSTRKVTAMGVAAYDFDGGKRFHVVPHAVAHLELVYRGHAYVGFEFSRGPYLIIDVDSGHVVGKRTSRLPQLLREQASPFWGNGY
jgi:hypothetical protein